MTDDELVAAYLRRLRRASRQLPRAQRKELIDHITEYITESRAAGAVSAEDTTAELRNALERLGKPEDIVAAANGPAPARRLGGLEITAVLMLLLGGLVVGLIFSVPGFLVGWGIGVVLLWISPRWRWPDKLLGTLVWPGGLAGVFLLLTLPVTSQTCSGSGAAADCTGGSVPHLWLSIPITVLLGVGPVLVAARLLKRARPAAGPGEPVVTGLTG